MALLGLFVVVGFTVPIGERTLFSHLANIWGSSEAQELVEGVKDSSGPLVDRLKRGVEAGLADETKAEPAEPQGGQKEAERSPQPAADERQEQVPLATSQSPSKSGDTTQ